MHAAVTFVAKYFIVIPLLCAFIVFLHMKGNQRYRFLIFGVVASAAAIVLAKIGSQLYYDPRPFVTHHSVPYFPHGSDNGFPSDHSLLSFTLAFIALRYDRRLGWIALIAAALVGSARVIAGVHHVSDVVGSIIFAAIGVGVAMWVDNKVTQRTVAEPPKRL
jgi:undecaprenyl-diphosphatase